MSSNDEAQGMKVITKRSKLGGTDPKLMSAMKGRFEKRKFSCPDKALEKGEDSTKPVDVRERKDSARQEPEQVIVRSTKNVKGTVLRRYRSMPVLSMLEQSLKPPRTVSFRP